MIKPQLQRPFIHGIIRSATTTTTTTTAATLPLWSSRYYQVQQRQKVKRLLLLPRNVQANTSTSSTATDTDEKKKDRVKLKAVVKVKITRAGFFSSLRLDRGIDDLTDLLGKSLLLELVSSHLHPQTEEEKETIKAYAHKAKRGEESVKYEAEFEVPNDFGEIGAVLVENEHHTEMFLETIHLDGFPEAQAAQINHGHKTKPYPSNVHLK